LIIEVKAMELIDFSQFASRRARRTAAHADMATVETPVFDRWADLHTERPDVTVAPVTDSGERDFWYDLQFRLAYPTHRLRRH